MTIVGIVLILLSPISSFHLLNEPQFPSISMDHLDKQDPRVSYDQISKKYIFEDEENGLEYEYNEQLKKWVPIEDEDAIKLQQKAYDDQAEDEQSKPTTGKKKRPKQHENTSNESNKRRKQNTGIYITELPNDVTIDELDHVFSKYGVIAEDLINGNKKIKLYYNERTSQFKGDALILYFKPESVDLAIQMMDDAPLRYDGSGKPGVKIKVEKAKFSKNEEKPKKETDIQEKSVIKKRYEKLNEKLADWDDNDIDHSIPKRWEKVALFKHVFTLEELKEDVEASLDIKQDLMEGCESIGPVTSVTLYDLEPEGIAMVKFKNKENVEKCIDLMKGRYFGGKRLEVSKYDGLIKYNRTRKGEEDEQEENKRLDEFGNWLDGERKGEVEDRKEEVESRRDETKGEVEDEVDEKVEEVKDEV